MVRFSLHIFLGTVAEGGLGGTRLRTKRPARKLSTIEMRGGRNSEQGGVGGSVGLSSVQKAFLKER